MKYTVFIREADGTGTTYITSVDANSVDEAKAEALEMCAADWNARTGVEGDYMPYELHVLGVALGDVTILEWDGQE